MRYLVAYLIYGMYIAWLSVDPGQPSSALYVAICGLIAFSSFIVFYNPWQRDLLEPIKLAAIFYGLSFGLGPLLIGPDGYFEIWYLGGQEHRLLELGSAICLISYLLVITAYYLTPGKGGVGDYVDGYKSIKPRKRFVLSGALVFILGLSCYLILLVRSGGVNHFVSYEGGRAEIFGEVFGGFYWGSFFLIAGLSVIGASIVGKHPLVIIVSGVFIGLLYALFQGRAAAIAPVFVSLVIINYGYKRLSPRIITIAAIILILLASLLGVYRAADKKESNQDVTSFVSEFLANSKENIVGTIAIDIQKLNVVLIAFKYIDDGGEPLKGKTVLGWLGPINRYFLGGALDLSSAGTFLNGLVNPRLKNLRTGIVPSMPGELYLNFGLFGVLFGSLIYGVILKKIYNIIRYGELTPLRLAVYPYLLFMVTFLVINGFHSLFQLVVVLAGVFFVGASSRFKSIVVDSVSVTPRIPEKVSSASNRADRILSRRNTTPTQ